ncbi:glycosyltransferase family 4 protein [Paenibacillus silviterrae]|uniref:glycosyltransferase family 4 protein n=1 Tax=Paenibacillus silviterrae TaxID=3242194 RepID=UPI002543A2AE|nr:glycosyltransferase family 4 protein [Paenibacillus chinjuensis]
MSSIVLGCSSGFGQGGLGKHLEFIYQSAALQGKEAAVYCRDGVQSTGFVPIPGPAWERWITYTPIRWLPSWHVYEAGLQFDKRVEAQLPARPLVYHGFPGFAEHTFDKVRRNGGITVLEAATTHVGELYPSVSQEHRSYRMGGSPFSASWVRKVLREYGLADRITVASRLQWETFVRHGVPESKLVLVPLGVDTRMFSPAHEQASRKPYVPMDTFRIIQLGQVSLLKGFPYLLEAMVQLRDPKLELVLYGGVGWRAVRKLIEQYRSRGLNIRLGSGNPLPALREAHLCVHSSISDGFGLAPLEAMSVGLPTIVTDGTGMKDVIRHGENGFIVPKRSSEAIAECIARLKADNALRLQVGEEARKAALEYDITLMTQQYGERLLPVWESVG